MGEPERLDTGEPLPERVQRHDYDRLIMLSDGVFSIAMTLLVLEVKPLDTAGPLWLRLGPSIWAFVLSFAIAAFFWVGNKRLFARVRRVDVGLTTLSLVLLGLIALLPAATSLLYRTWSADTAAEADILYLGLIALIGLTQGAAWAHAGFVAHLLDPTVSTRMRLVSVTFNTFTPVTIAGVSIWASVAHSSGVTIAAVLIGAAVVAVRRRLAREPAAT